MLNVLEKGTEFRYVQKRHPIDLSLFQGVPLLGQWCRSDGLWQWG